MPLTLTLGLTGDFFLSASSFDPVLDRHDADCAEKLSSISIQAGIVPPIDSASS